MSVDTLISPLSFIAVKLEATLAEPTQFRADAERLSDIIMEMQRCFLLHLCKELAPGNVSFSQYFLLAALDQKEVLTMSAIAQKMGHTTAAASGLVARLTPSENKAWLQIYSKIYDFCQAKHSSNNRWEC